MKKIIALILSLISVFSLAACSTTVQTIDIDAVKPWDNDYERLEYSVSKQTGNGTEIASGQAVFTLKTTGEDSTISLSFELTYNDKADSADIGKTDKIESAAIVTAKSLRPKSSSKTVTLADRNNSDGTEVKNKSYTLICDYNDTKKATLTMYGETQEADLSGLTGEVQFFDNETVFYALRALKGIETGGSGQFQLSHLFDKIIYGRDSALYTMAFSCGSDSSIYEINNTELKTQINSTSGNATVIETSLQISGDKSGPAIKVLFSDSSFNPKDIITVKKLPLKMETKEYNYSTLTVAYNTVYTLSGYSYKE